MLSQAPYFMKNKEWYYYDIEEGICKLTDAAPEEARKSYEDFYYHLEHDKYDFTKPEKKQ